MSVASAKKQMLPIQSSHLKVIRQSEVYIMEEAVTDTLIKSAATKAEENRKKDEIKSVQPDHSDKEEKDLL